MEQKTDAGDTTGRKRKRLIYNLKQILLPSIIFLAFFAYDIWFFNNVKHYRSSGDYISDVRIINQYCNYYLVFISVIIGFLMTLPKNRETKENNTLNIPIFTFFVSLVAVSLNLIFFPVPYSDSWPVKYLWFFHIVCGQAVVIFTAFGLLGLLRAFMQMHPID